MSNNFCQYNLKLSTHNLTTSTGVGCLSHALGQLNRLTSPTALSWGTINFNLSVQQTNIQS